MHESESLADVARWSEHQSMEKWSAILGPLRLRRSPYVCENSRACQSGEHHLSYVLYGRTRGHRVSIYLPEDLVPEVERASDNDRAMRELMYERDAHALQRHRSAEVG